MELDHVFLCVEDPEGAERALAEFGVQVSRRSVHRGQGTANAVAFFDNAYLELLWRHADEELRSDVVRPLGLWERVRWRETGASPFGVAFRPGEGDPALETWAYEAPFLPAGAVIPIVTPRGALHEPVVFLSTPSRAPATLPPERRPPLEHRGARRRLTGVTVAGPGLARRSPGIEVVCGLGVLVVKEAAEHHLELVWDEGREGREQDFRPVLPLTVRW